MEVTYNPAQTGNVVSAPEYNANLEAFQTALDSIESKISGVVSDLHGEGVLRGLQLIDGGNFVTITPGIAYVEGIRLLLDSACNVALPPYSVCRAWILDDDDNPAIVNVPAERTSYADNSASIVYDGTTSRTSVYGTFLGYATTVESGGTITISYSGEGPMHLMLSRDSSGGTGAVQMRTQATDGTWGSWEEGTAETEISFYSATTQYRKAVCIGAPDPEGATKQVRITATGKAYIEGFYCLQPDGDITPSDYAMALAWIYTGANGDIDTIVDTRSSIVLSDYWSKLIETMYKLLATQIICTSFWFDGFGSSEYVGLSSTCRVDSNAHQADMGALPPYPTSSYGVGTIQGSGTSKTETLVLSRTPVALFYPKVSSGSVVVKNATGTVTYASGYTVDYTAGTIAWDSEADPQPITENETVQVSYTGLSTVVLTAREPGDKDVLVEISEGSTASVEQATKTWLSQRGAQVYTFSPKTGVLGKSGNGVKVKVENGTNTRYTLAEKHFDDRAVPPTESMELKSKTLGLEGNFVRSRLSNDTGQRIQEDSFEEVSPSAWTFQANSKGTISISSAQKRTGSYSLGFDKTVDGSRMRAYQLFDAKPGFEYQVTFYFASTNCTSDINGTARILSADRSTEVAASQFLDSTTRNSLTFASATFTFSCPATMNRLALSLDVDDGTGDVWVDDCTVTVVTPDSFKLEVEDGHLAPFFDAIEVNEVELSASSDSANIGKMIDADKTTYWQGGASDSWVAADFATAPQTITGIAVFVPQGILEDSAAIQLETQDESDEFTVVRSGTVKAGWCSLRIPGSISCYGIRITTAAPIAILKVFGDTEGTAISQHDTSLTDNLVEGGGFEGWETRSGTQQPIGWTRKVAGVLASGAYSTQESVVLSGTKSAEDTSATDNVGTYETDTMAVYVGKEYLAYAMVRATGLSSAEVSASVIPVVNSVEGTPIPLLTESGASSITANCEWTLLAVRFTATAETVKLSLKRDGVGTVYWDSVELFLVGETYRNLTLDGSDSALGWEVPYAKAENAVNSGNSSMAASELVTLVNLTEASGFEDEGADCNPTPASYAYLSGGGTQYVTVKVTVERYSVDSSGNPTETLISSEVFDNLTTAANDVPGGFTPVNEDLETTIDQESSIVNVAVSVSKSSSTYLDNPALGSSFLSGGETDYDTVNLDLYATSVVIGEAEDLLSAQATEDFYATNVDFDTETSDTGASGGSYISGTGELYLHVTEPLAKLAIVYNSSSTFGHLLLSVAEYDSTGVLGSFSSVHESLLVAEIDQSQNLGQQQTVVVAQRMVGTYADGTPKHYVLKLAPESGSCNVDAFTLYVVSQHESFADLSVCPSVFSQSGKSSLTTVINSGYGGQGPSSIVTASANNYATITDNPSLGSLWLEGEEGETQVLYGPILDSAPLAYWDKLSLYADTYLPEGTSITFQYCLNPLDASPVWAPLTAGILNTLNGSVGDNKLQLRAIFATSYSGLTPVLYNWGVFWGSPSYVPEGAQSIVLSGDAYILSTSNNTASESETGFHASSSEVVEGAGVINIPVSCRPSRITLSLESVYIGPYHSWGENYAQEYGNPYDTTYYGKYGYWDAYGYHADYSEVEGVYQYFYNYGYYGYNWPSDYFGWRSVAVDSFDGSVGSVEGNTVEIYVGGMSENQFSIFWRFPVGWQTKVHWVCEGWR